VIVVTPELKVCVPTLLIPVAGELPVVAPVIAQVNLVTPQLSAVVGFVVFTEAVHNPAAVFTLTLDGQVIVGACVSVTVTVKLHVAVNPAGSVTV
jgi:hypothetical protein